jgi:CHAD domain-containing protein
MRAAAARPVRAIRPRLAPGASAEEAFRALFAASLAQAARNAAGAARGRDPEYLHQLRVGLRRLRASLRAFRPVVPRAVAARVLAPLREMARVLGEARDWDVAGARLEALARGAGADGEPLAREVRSRRRDARLRLRRVLRGGAFERWLRAARRWQAEAPWRNAGTVPARESARPLEAHARKRLKRMHRRLLREAGRLRWNDAPARHAFRIRLKRFRYACEFFAPVLEERAAGRLVGRLKRLQDLLGALNDCAVALRLLDEIRPRDRARRDALRACLRARLAAEASSLQKRLPAAWRDVRGARGFW